MSSKKTVRSILKHSIYASSFESAELATIANMPVDDISPELSALRLMAAHFMSTAAASPYFDHKLRLYRLAMRALSQSSELILKRQALPPVEDPMRDLLDALREANRLEGIPKDL